MTSERQRRRGGWVAWGSLIAVAYISISGAASAAVSLPDDPLSGRALFVTKGCVRCHGIAGSGPSIGPGLGEGSFSGSFLELGASLWNHAPAMSVTFEVTHLEWPVLVEEEATELMAFLYFIDYLGRPGVAQAGENVFGNKGCIACHDVGGRGSGVGGDLADLQLFASPLYIAQEIWNHGPSMLASMRDLGMEFPSFDVGDFADLSAFVRREAQAGRQERSLLAPGNPNAGKEIFSRKGCAICHGEGGRGGRYGPDIGALDLHRSAESIAGTMWNHALGMRESMRSRGVEWPVFSGNELADLVSFLYFLSFQDPPGDAERGAAVFSSHSCADCHGPEVLADEPGQPDPLRGAPVSPATLVSAMWNHAPIMKKAILGEGLPWPELSGDELRDLRAYFERETGTP